VPTGHKPIEQFRVGDLVLSRDESLPEGPVEAKVVEALFVRTGRVLHVHAGGEVIATTGKHPFFVHGKGWVQASLLQAGDELVGHDLTRTPVEEVFDTGLCATVYNLRVADYHTYFVGGLWWGFSAWAHNACKVQVGTAPDPGNFTGRTTGTLSWEEGGVTKWVKLTSGERNAAEAGLDEVLPGASAANYHHVESQAVQLMNKLGINEAKLVINHPEGLCGYCSPRGYSHILEEGLQNGSVLEIFNRQGDSLLRLVGRFMW
jgi:hypothetical protein